MPVANSKQNFRTHLENLGFDFSGQPPAILQRLRQHMGEQRFAEYQSIVATVHDGDSYNQIYDFMHDLKEANLLRSMSPDVTFEVSFRLYERCFAQLRPGARVLELGCWTGGLASFVAQHHPGCAVIGVDRAQRIIQVDRSHFKLPNLSFIVWDYRQPKPDDLEPADVLLCGLGINLNWPPGHYNDLDPSAVRKASAYRDEKAELMPYFAHWRQAAKNEAKLLSALRMVAFPRFLAVIDAAREAGWKPLLDEIDIALTDANKEIIPLLSFVTGDAGEISEDLALSHWMRLMSKTYQLISLTDAAALGMYRALGPKQQLARRQFTNDAGFAAAEEIGICGPFGYIYTQDARPTHRLELVSIPAIHQHHRTAVRSIL